MSDFVWLRARLRATLPGAILPPLPSRNRDADEPTSEKVDVRRAKLQVFLSRCAAHPLLSVSPELFLFLTEADATSFAERRDGGTPAQQLLAGLQRPVEALTGWLAGVGLGPGAGVGASVGASVGKTNESKTATVSIPCEKPDVETWHTTAGDPVEA